METHATRSPVPGDPDTYNHWMSDEDILKMARVVRFGDAFLVLILCVLCGLLGWIGNSPPSQY